MRLLFLICLLFTPLTLCSEEPICLEADVEQPEPVVEAMVLDLPKAISIALANNLQLKNSEDSTVNAQYQVDSAWSEFDLDISPAGDVGYAGGGCAGSGSAFSTGLNIYKKIPFGTQISVTPLISKTNKTYFTNVRTIITQPLLRGVGKRYNLSPLRSAQFGFRSATRSLFSAQCQLVARVCNCLYDIIKAERGVVLSQESFNRITYFFQAAKLKANIGMSDPLDLHRAELEMQQAEDALKTSQEKMEEAQDVLRDLLALPLDIPIKLNLPVVYAPIKVPFKDALKIAKEHRVEIDQVNDQRQETKRLSCVAKDRLWPELNLVFNYSSCGQDQLFMQCWNWGRRVSTWGVGLTTSNFDASGERVAYEQSLLAIEASTRGMQQTISNVTLEVKRAIRMLERTQQRIDLLQEQIKISEGEMRLAEIKFRRGMSNNFDLIQAEKSLRNAQLNHWNALIDYMMGEVQLRGALGLLLEKPNL